MNKKGGKRTRLSAEQKAKILELREGGATMKEIAGKMGLSLSCIFKYTGKSRGGAYTPSQLQTLVIKHNYNLSSVGRELGFNRTYVSQLLRQNNLDEWLVAGKKKYKKELPGKILELHKDGVSINVIAELTKKSLMQVVKILGTAKEKNK